MSESEELKKLELHLRAVYLIELIPLVYNIELNEDNFEKVLYLVYGLNKKQSRILRKAIRGEFCKSLEAVVEKATEELVKFLNVTGYIVSIEIFWEVSLYEHLNFGEIRRKSDL